MNTGSALVLQYVREAHKISWSVYKCTAVFTHDLAHDLFIILHSPDEQNCFCSTKLLYSSPEQAVKNHLELKRNHGLNNSSRMNQN